MGSILSGLCIVIKTLYKQNHYRESGSTNGIIIEEASSECSIAETVFVRIIMLIIEVLILQSPPPSAISTSPIMSLSFLNNVAPGVGYWGEKNLNIRSSFNGFIACRYYVRIGDISST